MRSNVRLLEGLTVVEIARRDDLAVPLTGSLFNSHGAEVATLRVPGLERTGYSVNSELLDMFQKGKSPIEGASGFQIAQEADLIISSFDEGRLRGAGLYGDGSGGRAPSAVFTHVAPFRENRDYSDWRTSEFVLQGMGGMLATTGQPEDPPTQVGVRIADHLTALYAGVASLAGVMLAVRTTQGSRIEVASLDCLVTSLTNFIADYRAAGRVHPRSGNRHIFSSPWNCYKTADGFVVICVVRDGEWKRLCDLLGIPELGADPAFLGQENRRAKVDMIDQVVEEWTLQRTTRDILDSLGRSGIPSGDVQSVNDVLESGYWRNGIPTYSEGSSISPPPLVRVFDERESPAGVVERATSRTGRDRPGTRRLETPLDGYRVVEIAMLAAGPLCGRLLGNLGADVVKIEPPRGEMGRSIHPLVGGESAIFNINCNDKRSVCIDLTDERGVEVSRSLIASSDALVENLTPGRLRSWGIGFEDLATINPGLVYASITGFGQDASKERLRAYDTVVQATGGVMDLTGFPSGPPTKAGISLSDYLGGVAGAFGIMAGLYARRKHDTQPKAVHLDVAMWGVTAWTTMSEWPRASRHAPLATRHGNSDPNTLWQGVISCTDGDIAVTLESYHDVKRLLALADCNQDKYSGRDDRLIPCEEDLVTALVRWAAEKTRAQAVTKLQASRIAAGPVLTVQEILEDQNISGDLIGTVGGVEGISHNALPVVGLPFHSPNLRLGPFSNAPALGADTVEILRQVFDVSDITLDDLIKDGVVGAQREGDQSVS